MEDTRTAEGFEQEETLAGEEQENKEPEPETEDPAAEETGNPGAEEESESPQTEETAGESADAGNGDEETGRRGFFGRKKKDKRDTQIEELTDRVKRQMAEFDNFRKRTEKEKASMFETGQKSVLEKILPALDNFERGLAAVSPDQKEDPIVTGMDKIYRQLLTTLESMGVTPIEAVGQPFDPNFHNAVMHVEDEEAGENIVVEEFQKGYLFHDSVLRHSMVKVAN